MGKTGSKVERLSEQVIIAQNGAGNRATADQEESQVSTMMRHENYLLFIIACILMLILYMMWRYLKNGCGTYLRRQLQEVPMVEMRAVDSGSRSCPPQRIIV